MLPEVERSGISWSWLCLCENKLCNNISTGSNPWLQGVKLQRARHPSSEWHQREGRQTTECTSCFPSSASFSLVNLIGWNSRQLQSILKVYLSLNGNATTCKCCARLLCCFLSCTGRSSYVKFIALGEEYLHSIFRKGSWLLKGPFRYFCLEKM